MRSSVQVVCAGVNVEPGDVVVADDDGVVVIPKKVAVDTRAEGAGSARTTKTENASSSRAGTLSLDMYKMREPLAKAGLVYIDRPEDN